MPSSCHLPFVSSSREDGCVSWRPAMRHPRCAIHDAPSRLSIAPSFFDFFPPFRRICRRGVETDAAMNVLSESIPNQTLVHLESDVSPSRSSCQSISTQMYLSSEETSVHSSAFKWTPDSFVAVYLSILIPLRRPLGSSSKKKRQRARLIDKCDRGHA